MGGELLATAGLLLLCLLRTRLRWSGVGITAIVALWVVLSPRPDIYVAGDGRTAALRGTDGRLSVLHSGRDTFAIREWLAADADSRAAGDKTLGKDVRCDEAGCVGRLRDGRVVAMPLAAEAFADDCAQAFFVISPLEAPEDCRALLFDRRVWRERGAMSVRVNREEIIVSEARPKGYERPWTKRPRRNAVQQPTPVREATPQPNSLEADD